MGILFWTVYLQYQKIGNHLYAHRQEIELWYIHAMEFYVVVKNSVKEKLIVPGK